MGCACGNVGMCWEHAAMEAEATVLHKIEIKHPDPDKFVFGMIEAMKGKRVRDFAKDTLGIDPAKTIASDVPMTKFAVSSSSLPERWERGALSRNEPIGSACFRCPTCKLASGLEYGPCSSCISQVTVQGEIDAPGTPRPANCTCSSFVRCTSCTVRASVAAIAANLACDHPQRVDDDEYPGYVTCTMCGKMDPVEIACGIKKLELEATIDPLDVEYDGHMLRDLLERDRIARHTDQPKAFTAAQRAAVSAHWSAQLRAKVAAAKQADRNVVTYCELDADD